MGKPPRERLRIPEEPSVSRTPGEYRGSIDRDRPCNNSCTSGSSGSVVDGSVLTSGLFPNINNVPSVWGAVDGYPNSLMTSVDAPDAFHGDLLGPSLQDFLSMEFDDDLLPALASPELEGYSTPEAQTKHSQNQVDESLHFDSTLMPPAGNKGHDCSREAYDILGSLSFLKLKKAYSISQSPPGSASMTANTANPVPLDHVLCLNREISERLGRLLACSCARSPHLALLYASIISQILIWYQQAAGCTQSTSWSPVAVALDTASQQGSLTESSPKSGSGCLGEFFTWSNTAASTFSSGSATSTSALADSTGLAVTPAKMAIGTFNVDDSQVQTALRIQLLSGEMRRAGCLIDQFTSHNSGGHGLAEEYAFGGVNSLYQSLDSWLRGGHSRIVNMMRSKLRELNT